MTTARSISLPIRLLLVSLVACTAEADETVEPPPSAFDPVAGTCALTPEPSDAFADCVEDFSPGPGASFGHDMLPQIVLGPPVGGDGMGSLDVASLGCDGRITLAFSGDGIVDGPGPDFIVFENPFEVGEQTFAEPAFVGVSEDGETFSFFPCDLDGSGAWPPTGCAGIEPVLSSPENGVPATDPEAAGGDAFDLAAVGLTRARYVRLVDASVAYHGHDMWCTGAAGGFDLDAIARVER